MGMRNSLTVTVDMGWAASLDPEERDQLSKSLMKLAKDKASLGCQEAGRLLSGMAGKGAAYSYEARPLEVDFEAYAKLSNYVPGSALRIRLSKAGEDVKLFPPDDYRHYNLVCVDFADGQIAGQWIGHLEPGGAEPEDTVRLPAVRQKLSMLKDAAEQAAQANRTAAPGMGTKEAAEFQARDYIRRMQDGAAIAARETIEKEAGADPAFGG